MSRIHRLTTLVLASALLLGSAGSALAASYGDFFDPTGFVAYRNVQDLNGLFGAPSVSLNSLDFTPLNFEARCSQCPTGASTTDTLTLDIDTVAGRAVNEIRVTEGLDFSVLSFDPTGFASASVSANLFIDVLEIDGVAVNGINANASMLYTPSNASVFGFGIQSGVMTGDLTIDVAQIIAAAGAVGDATLVRISLDNTLSVFHDGSGGEARIRKRDADFVSMTIVVTQVPEPTTAVFLLGGLAGLAAQRRRQG
jgi:hypothetical protein